MLVIESLLRSVLSLRRVSVMVLQTTKAGHVCAAGVCSQETTRSLIAILQQEH